LTVSPPQRIRLLGRRRRRRRRLRRHIAASCDVTVASVGAREACDSRVTLISSSMAVASRVVAPPCPRPRQLASRGTKGRVIWKLVGQLVPRKTGSGGDAAYGGGHEPSSLGYTDIASAYRRRARPRNRALAAAARRRLPLSSPSIAAAADSRLPGV